VRQTLRGWPRRRSRGLGIVRYRGAVRETRPPVTNKGVAASLPTMSSAGHVHDRELLTRARAGDAEAFAGFYRARRGEVLAFLRVRVPNAELAADLMCESFAKALIAVHDADRELPIVPVAWLLTIARNELTDSVRRGRVADDTRRRLAMQPLELSDRDLAAVDDATADADLLGELRELLPADQLQALTARVIDEREYAEIAQELQTSESVVRKRVSRALAQLRSIRQEAS
jgi:RNA polymerase sigma factor (sigma-70 family)